MCILNFIQFKLKRRYQFFFSNKILKKTFKMLPLELAEESFQLLRTKQKVNFDELHFFCLFLPHFCLGPSSDNIKTKYLALETLEIYFLNIVYLNGMHIIFCLLLTRYISIESNIFHYHFI